MERTRLQLYDFTPMDASYVPIGKGQGRKSGVHVSGLIKAYFKAQGEPEPKSPESWQTDIGRQAGFLWENAMEFAFKEYMAKDRSAVIKQLRTETDGVHGTPDGLDGDVLEEYKCTWKSLRKWEEDPEANFQYWFMQVKAYLYMLDLRKVRFFIFFVNGDYKWDKGLGPRIVRTEEFEFTKEELEDNWLKLMAHRKEAKHE